MSAAQVVALWGDEHPTLDELAAVALDERTAVALSRGRFPKPYAHVDPNEDAVAAAGGPAGRLLAVADGHFGFDAARAAMRAVTRRAGDVVDPAARPEPEAALEELCRAAARAASDAVAGVPAPRSDSRTALTLALAGDDHLHVATYGDTACVRVRGRRTKVFAGTSPFLGPGSGVARVQRVRLRAGDQVMVASDGLTDYLGRDWPVRIADVLAGSEDPRDAVRRLVELAMTGGAGDHVAVGVLL